MQRYEPAIFQLSCTINFYATAELFERKFNIELQATTGSQDGNKENNNENDSTLTNRDNSASAGSITIPALQHHTCLRLVFGWIRCRTLLWSGELSSEE